MTDPGTLTDGAALVAARLSELFAQRRSRAQAFPVAYADLWDSLARLAAGGKKIRPRLLMRAYHALGGTDERVAVDTACAVELLHLALLIHDDVIDKDLTRRGELNISGRFALEATLRGADRPAASGWGEASSILAGDLILVMAQSLLARLDIAGDRRRAVIDLFDDTVFESAAGEHQDAWLSLHLAHTSADEVLAMIDRKTAAYSFRAPLVLAAILAGADAAVIDQLAVIARQVGIVYQLRDDVLGLFGDERETGKSTVSDLREGKETLLIAYARSDPAWGGVEYLFGDRSLGASDAARLRRVIEESGARLFVESAISDRCQRIRALIRQSDLPAELKNDLAELTSACGARAS